MPEADPADEIGAQEHSQCRKGVGKLIHLSKCSRAETLNAVRELSRFGSCPNPVHCKAMMRALRCCGSTKDRGLLLKPKRRWNGKDKNFLFQIMGRSDSAFASCLETGRSTSGWAACLEGAPCVRKSKMQPFVTASVAEAEAVAGASCAMDMLHGKHFMEALGHECEYLAFRQVGQIGSATELLQPGPAMPDQLVLPELK